MEAQLGGTTVQKLRHHSITRLMLNIVPKEDIGHMCRLVRLPPGTELLPQGRPSWQVRLPPLCRPSLGSPVEPARCTVYSQVHGRLRELY